MPEADPRGRKRGAGMIRDITIGQYYAADSIIHKLDPRVKLAGTMLYIISLFTADGPICYLLAVFALAAVIHLSTVPFKFMARGLKSIVIYSFDYSFF